MILHCVAALCVVAGAFGADGEKIHYAGRKMPPESFKLRCKPTSSIWIRDSEKSKGKAVYVEGRIDRKGKDWSFSTYGPQADDPLDGKCTVIPDEIYAPKFKEGQTVRVWGVVDGGTRAIQARIIELSPPDIAYEYSMNPVAGAVYAGSDKSYSCRISVKNTSRQTLQTLKVGVNFSQISSPANWTQEFILVDFKPGEVKTFNAPFSFFNYQYIGGTSVPTCRVGIISYTLPDTQVVPSIFKDQ